MILHCKYLQNCSTRYLVMLLLLLYLVYNRIHSTSLFQVVTEEIHGTRNHYYSVVDRWSSRRCVSFRRKESWGSVCSSVTVGTNVIALSLAWTLGKGTVIALNRWGHNGYATIGIKPRISSFFFFFSFFAASTERPQNYQISSAVSGTSLVPLNNSNPCHISSMWYYFAYKYQVRVLTMRACATTE